MENPKEEPKYPIGGYAPGNYMCYCAICKIKFQGDKRASQCEPCAVAMTKEEAKQRAANYMRLKGALEPKQETLEKAAEQYWAKQPYNEDAFIEGAKWMQERSYSEEEVQNLIKIIEWYDDNSDVRPNCDKEIDGLTMWDWFEQFKKKQQ